MLSRQQLDSKTAGSTILAVFDFTSELNTGEVISSAGLAASVYSGTDPAPSALITGGLTISGAQVSQMLTGGVVGVIYEILCTANTTFGRTQQKPGFLSVIPDL